MVEAASCDWLVELLGGLQLGARVFVPEAEASVGAHGGQRAVDRMEGDGVNLVRRNGSAVRLTTNDYFSDRLE